MARRNKGDDLPPFEVGAAILKGDYSRKNLDALFTWKTRGRGRSRIAVNTDAEVEDALKLAVAASTPRAAIAVLTGLSGCAVPVASAIMTCVRPEIVHDYRLPSFALTRRVNFKSQRAIFLKLSEFLRSNCTGMGITAPHL